MLLSELLADPDLGLVPRSGEDHAECEIRGVYVTDLIDPRRYLEGGELVLSGLVWHNDENDSRRFVQALVDAGVAGLAAGTARLGHAPDDLVAECRRQGLPIFEVPLSVSFNTLTERVLRAQRKASAPRRELVSAIAAGADLDRVLAMASAELGVECLVLSAAGWCVGGTPGPPERVVTELVRAYLESERLPKRVRLSESEVFALWPGGSDVEPRAARWFVAIRVDEEMSASEQEAVAVELGIVVALVRTRIDEVRRIAGRSVETVLRRLLDGSAGPPEVVAALDAAGLPAGMPLRVVELGTAVGSSSALLRELAAATGLPAVTAPLHDGASALFVDDAARLAELEELLRKALGGMSRVADAAPVALGLSDVSSVGGLRGALEEANHARRLADRRPPNAAIATAAELASHQVLLASVPDGLRDSYSDRLLGKLVAYDRGHHSDLVRTLRVFLEHSASWSRCAKQLHVHVNTLRYRIRRIEEITGRDLAHFPDRVDFYLALELARETGETHRG
ncbi:PucR family transcriptional regulator [Parasphingorhabdus pacifica]